MRALFLKPTHQTITSSLVSYTTVGVATYHPECDTFGQDFLPVSVSEHPRSSSFRFFHFTTFFVRVIFNKCASVSALPVSL